VNKPIAAPFGTWTSPIQAHMVAAASLRLGGVVVDGDDIYWVEGRPEDGGRNVVVRRASDGRTTDISPPTANVRTRVHEYGGAAYAVSNGTLYYVDFNDHCVYRLAPGHAPEAITPAGDWFYADFAVDKFRKRLLCVREDHTVSGREATTTLVSVRLAGPPSSGEILASGHDFYAAPRLSPDGTKLSWLAWRHPQMPWDGTELWVADIAADSSLVRARLVAGGNTESIFQPGWSPDGTLYFTSDRTGWWNLYRVDGTNIVPVCPMDAEFGRPMWALGTTTWAFAGPSRVVAAFARESRWRLATIDVTSGALEPIASEIEPGDSLAATETHVVLLGGTPRTPDAIVRIDIATGTREVLRHSSTVAFDAAYLSKPEPIDFPTDNGSVAHAFVYPPANPLFTSQPGERPPLIVFCHGGPTGAATGRLNLEVQYWTSRGFAVADVNYGGSASYGRAYRERLRGRWGVVDVRDCENAARFLAARGDVDPGRLAIRGRSAGGYTTLAALVSPGHVFNAGASYYGVADLERLALDTHKFESRYLDGLIGPYPAAQELYLERSPIYHLDELRSPLILLQGLEDRVVPPNQAQLMADAVRAKGLPVALLTFAGEQHGFRKAETVVRCLEAELFFYGAVFGFTPAGAAPDLAIDNLRTR
jgi:dipeptidyl aminopeptidase/acylaminoacyl peptidase